MSADFNLAIPQVLENEGGLSNDSSDPGGLTNYGISQRSYPNEDIRGLTVERAKEIYKRDFWDANQLGTIKDQRVAGKLMDMCVNMGASRAGKIIQQSLANDFRMTVQIDGKIGAKTISAINSQDPLQILKALKRRCVEFYTELAERKPEMQRFLKGWLRRAGQ